MHASVSLSSLQSRPLVLRHTKLPATKRVTGAPLHSSRSTFTCAAEGKSVDRTVGDKLAEAQKEVKKRIDREDLYTDNWGGDVWKGGKVNVLSVILAVSVLVPLGGLLFAYLTFGQLWG